MSCIKQKYTALSGDRVVFPCPIQPGALLRYYSVQWTKDDIKIATAPNCNSKYRIDRTTYALIIDPVSVNDTSSSYQCQVAVTYPNTNNKLVLRPTSGVSLSLTVVATSKFNPAVIEYVLLQLVASMILL
jgi:hypothetical protein